MLNLYFKFIRGEHFFSKVAIFLVLLNYLKLLNMLTPNSKLESGNLPLFVIRRVRVNITKPTLIFKILRKLFHIHTSKLLFTE